MEKSVGALIPFQAIIMRKSFSKIILVSVLAASVCSGLWLPRCGHTADMVDRIVAVVNDDIITLSELNEAFKPYRDRVRSMRYPLEKERKLLFEAREQVLDQLVNQKLTDQQVKKMNIQVSDKEVDAAIERIKSVNYYSDEDLRELLQSEGIDYETYRDRIKAQILRSRLVNREVNSKIVITQEDVAGYYNAHIDEYRGESRYHLYNIIKRVPPLADRAQKEEIREEIERIYARLKAGADFSDMARRHSDSPVAYEGGDLGVFALSSLAPEIQKALEGLSAGEFTPVIETDLGFQVFYVAEILEDKGQSLEEVTPKIQEILYQQAVDKRFEEWIKRLRKESHIKISR